MFWSAKLSGASRSFFSNSKQNTPAKYIRLVRPVRDVRREPPQMVEVQVVAVAILQGQGE
jgi:hypothetical protein